MKVRRKPVVMEAVQLTWANRREMEQFVPPQYFDRFIIGPAEELRMLLRTLESNSLTGSLMATQGDWIVKGVNGEVWPVKPDVFEQTYEIVP
jgi:hypothetical protein